MITDGFPCHQNPSNNLTVKIKQTLTTKHRVLQTQCRGPDALTVIQGDQEEHSHLLSFRWHAEVLDWVISKLQRLTSSIRHVCLIGGFVLQEHDTRISTCIPVLHSRLACRRPPNRADCAQFSRSLALGNTCLTTAKMSMS